jgi:membrane protein implicated in regulation of membrane protease activity
MLSPFMTVVVLAVLWLIVVVPMVLRRSDEMRRERSVDGFGRAMRALGRRASTVDAPADGVSAARSEVFVPRRHDDEPRGARASLAAPARRPVPAAQEALMYPPDRSELSEARAAMMARRRRSLGVLIGGSFIFVVAALVLGGAMWAIAGAFLAGLAGYCWFLRSQAMRDSARREHRQARAAVRDSSGYDVTEEVGRFEEPPETMVRIDDDDFELQSMDTIDLTGLYTEEPAETSQRRAS